MTIEQMMNEATDNFNAFTAAQNRGLAERYAAQKANPDRELTFEERIDFTFKYTAGLKPSASYGPIVCQVTVNQGRVRLRDHYSYRFYIKKENGKGFSNISKENAAKYLN